MHGATPAVAAVFEPVQAVTTFEETVERLGTAIHARFEAVQEHFGTMTTLAQENLSGVRVVRAYRQEDAELSRFDTLNEEYLRRNLHLVQLYGAMNPANSTMR